MKPAMAGMDPNSVQEYLERLLSGPAHPEHAFVLSRYTFRQVYQLAGQIHERFSGERGPVCVATEDRGVLAATLLASLSRGFPLILPYALSEQAISEIHQSRSLSTVVADRPDIVPENISAFIPDLRNLHPEILSLPLSVDPDSIILSFFTGGSTGKPKMWAKTPRNLFSEALFHSRRYGISETDCILATVPPYHIYGFLYSVLIPFVSSAGVVPEICTFPEEIRTAFRNHSPTRFASVPMHYRILNGTELHAPTLRTAFSSAGKLDPADADYFHRKTGADVVEIYGSTETGGIADHIAGSAGDATLTPFEVVEWKLAGERLCVRSPFISPDIETDADGFFRTGDRIEVREDGTFLLLGRADGIVKVGGKRVDLEWVRGKLKSVSGVSDAVVISEAREEGRENTLYAVVQGTVDPEGMKMVLTSAGLEPHATPRRIKVVDTIPVTASGKYDRQAIAALFHEV